MLKLKKVGFLAFLLVFALLLPACGQSQPVSSPDKSAAPGQASQPAKPTKVFKLGIIAPLSGSGASWGDPIVKAVELAVDEVKARGGLKVGNELYDIKVIAYDDKFTGDGGTAAANRLVFEDQVKFIVGSVGTASVLAFQAVTEPNKVLVLPNTYSPLTLSKDKPYTVRVMMTSAEYYPTIYAWLTKNRPSVKKVAMINPNDASGAAVADHSEKAIKDAGLQLVDKVFYERGIKDFYPILTKMLEKKPDFIDVGGTAPGELGLFLKQARELGYTGETASASPPDPKVLIDIAGKAADGHVWPMQPLDLPDNQAIKTFVEAYKKKYPDQAVNPIATLWYDPARMLLSTIEKTGSLDPATVRDALLKTEAFPGLYGPIKFGGAATYGVPNQLLGTSYLGQLKNGKQELISKLDVYSSVK